MATLSFVKAMTPKEVSVNKLAEIPGFVVEAFNNLLKLDFHPRAGYAILKKNDVINEIIKLAPYELSIAEVYKYRYLDIENIFTLQGWDVRFDNEQFTFTAK